MLGSSMEISTGNILVLFSSLAFSEIFSSVPGTLASGRAPTLMVAAMPTVSFPTSISSTVPLKTRLSMSAIVMRTVPAW